MGTLVVVHSREFEVGGRSSFLALFAQHLLVQLDYLALLPVALLAVHALILAHAQEQRVDDSLQTDEKITVKNNAFTKLTQLR